MIFDVNHGIYDLVYTNQDSIFIMSVNVEAQVFKVVKCESQAVFQHLVELLALPLLASALPATPDFNATASRLAMDGWVVLSVGKTKLKSCC